MAFLTRRFRFIASVAFITVFASCGFAQAATKKITKAAPSSTPAEMPSPTPMPSIEPLVIPEASLTPAPTPTPATTPEPAPVAEVKEVKEVAEETEASKSEFRMGPYVTAVALPRPLSAGLELKFNDFVGFSAGYGMIPQITIDANKLKLTGWDARIKLYPMGGSFFLGFGYGNQTFTGSRSDTIQSTAVTGFVDQDNAFILPHVGWNWLGKSGFFMGVDLGVQISLNRSTRFSTDTTNAAILASSQYADLRREVLDKAEQLGKTPLPLMTLLKIGFLF